MSSSFRAHSSQCFALCLCFEHSVLLVAQKKFCAAPSPPPFPRNVGQEESHKFKTRLLPPEEKLGKCTDIVPEEMLHSLFVKVYLFFSVTHLLCCHTHPATILRVLTFQDKPCETSLGEKPDPSQSPGARGGRLAASSLCRRAVSPNKGGPLDVFFAQFWMPYEWL